MLDPLCPVRLDDQKILKRSKIGAYTYLNGNVRVYGTNIGRFCSIGEGTFIGAPEHPTDFLSSHIFAYANGDGRFDADETFMATRSDESFGRHAQRTTIGNDVWIGANAVISRGITIGNGAIIGASAVVTKDVPAYAIVKGIPAAVHRFRFTDEIIERLQRIKWWDYHLDRVLFDGIPYSDVPRFLDRLEVLIASGEIRTLDEALKTNAHAIEAWNAQYARRLLRPEKRRKQAEKAEVTKIATKAARRATAKMLDSKIKELGISLEREIRAKVTTALTIQRELLRKLAVAVRKRSM